MDLKELLGEELYSQVTEKLGDKKIMVDDGNFIPKSRFDQVNEAKKELDTQLKDRDKQLKDLSNKAQGNEELTKQIEQLQLSNKQTQSDYESKISKMEFDFVLDKTLSSSKCKNSKALKALLDMDNVKLNEGKLEGLEEQLNSLKESDSYLFEVEETQTPPPGSGFNPQGGNSKYFTKADIENMSTEEINSNWEHIKNISL